VPKGITKVFRASTNTGYVIPRVVQGDSPEDNKLVRSVIMMYPLAEFDGKMKGRNWSQLPKTPSSSGGDEEVKWVVPETFFDVLPRAPASLSGSANAGARRSVQVAGPVPHLSNTSWFRSAVSADSHLRPLPDEVLRVLC